VRPKTPQQKKAESYAKDRRNTYGENAKSSRKNIARKKRRQNRAERRLASQAFAGERREVDAEWMDAIEARVERKRRLWWPKAPDEPLGVVVRAKLARRKVLALASKTLRQLLPSARGG
jgi:hypothetical protein